MSRRGGRGGAVGAAAALTSGLVWSLVAACAGAPGLIPDDPAAPPPVAPDSFLVAFETTAGPFRVMAHRAWSPAGVDRFRDLLRRGYYDDQVVFRVVEGFVVQFGLHGDPAVNAGWEGAAIPDEPVRVPNTRGRVSYARGGPHSRTVQLFINLRDNSPRLDTLSSGTVAGYPPIGEVVEGMDVVDRLEGKYGGAPAARQDSIRLLGNAWLERTYPDLDRILRARVVESWNPAP